MEVATKAVNNPVTISYRLTLPLELFSLVMNLANFGGPMHQVNIHDAKTNLSRLIEQAVNGEPFIIAKSGKPMVTVVAFSPPPDPAKRIGFLQGMIEVPDDFDTMGKDEIQSLFEGAR